MDSVSNGFHPNRHDTTAGDEGAHGASATPPPAAPPRSGGSVRGSPCDEPARLCPPFILQRGYPRERISSGSGALYLTAPPSCGGSAGSALARPRRRRRLPASRLRRMRTSDLLECTFHRDIYGTGRGVA